MTDADVAALTGHVLQFTWTDGDGVRRCDRHPLTEWQSRDLLARTDRAVEMAARELLEEMDRLTWGVPPEVDEEKDLVWFSGRVWAETRRKAEALRKAVNG